MAWVYSCCCLREPGKTGFAPIGPAPRLCDRAVTPLAQHVWLSASRPAPQPAGRGGPSGVGEGLGDHMTAGRPSQLLSCQRGPRLAAEPLFRPEPWPCPWVGLAREPLCPAGLDGAPLRARCPVRCQGVPVQCPRAGRPCTGPPNCCQRLRCSGSCWLPAGPDVTKIPQGRMDPSCWLALQEAVSDP